MALIAALLGWLFDGLEMGLFPLVAPDALLDLLPQGESVPKWLGIITALFLVGAATGGVLFGWLGDRIGRVRAMVLSVLTYALVSGLCGLATNVWQLGILRFIASLGMGGEWSLGVALINEIWPDRSRAFLAGLIGAAANVGYLLIAVVGIGLSKFLVETRGFLESILPGEWVSHLMSHNGWRLMMMFGALPALLTFLIRLYVPESSRWQREQEKGATSHWQTRDLLGVLIGSAGALGIIYLWSEPFDVWLQIVGSIAGFGVALIGFVYPVMRFLQRSDSDATAQMHRSGPTLSRMLLAAVLSGVALLGTWGTVQQAPTWASEINKNAPKSQQHELAKESTQAWAAVGAILGTIVAALVGGWLGRRITYFLLCLASFAIVHVFFDPSRPYDHWFLANVCGVGFITAAFYGWLPLYLPELFRTNVRATGQGFAFNFGRILAAVGVLQLGNLSLLFGSNRVDQLAGACKALAWIYAVGIVAIWLVPETKGKPLPD